mmetsp:Transcript_42584/g.133673  ORF Transcript_42584/g.133673 Transcript_42584/m.133673 type:complete len:201 (-) Transcript_42584:963-1565(-)
MRELSVAAPLEPAVAEGWLRQREEPLQPSGEVGVGAGGVAALCKGERLEEGGEAYTISHATRESGASAAHAAYRAQAAQKRGGRVSRREIPRSTARATRARTRARPSRRRNRSPRRRSGRRCDRGVSTLAAAAARRGRRCRRRGRGGWRARRPTLCQRGGRWCSAGPPRRRMSAEPRLRRRPSERPQPQPRAAWAGPAAP